MAGRSQGEAKTSLAARARPRGPPRSQSLTSRLVLLAAVPVGVAIALVSFLTAWRDGADGAAAESARLGVSAAVVAAISGSATAAGDRARALDALTALTTMPGVLYARIERADGAPLAESGGGVRPKRDVQATSAGLAARLTDRAVEASAPINVAEASAPSSSKS